MFKATSALWAKMTLLSVALLDRILRAIYLQTSIKVQSFLASSRSEVWFYLRRNPQVIKPVCLLCVYWTFYRCVFTGQPLILSSGSTLCSVPGKVLLPLCGCPKCQGCCCCCNSPSYLRGAVCKPTSINKEAKCRGSKVWTVECPFMHKPCQNSVCLGAELAPCFKHVTPVNHTIVGSCKVTV